MKSVMLLILGICFVSLTPAQENDNRHWFLKTDLVSYVPSLTYNTGKFNLELEIPHRENTALACDLAYIQSYGPSKPGDYIVYSVEAANTSGFLAGAEYKYYLGRRKPIEPLCLLIWPLVFQLNNNREQYTGLYISGHAAYAHTWSRVTHERYEELQQPYTVSRANPMAMVRLGFQSVSPRNIVVDQSLGLGIQYAQASAHRSFDPTFVFVGRQINTAPGFFPIINYSFKVGLAH